MLIPPEPLPRAAGVGMWVHAQAVPRLFSQPALLSKVLCTNHGCLSHIIPAQISLCTQEDLWVGCIPDGPQPGQGERGGGAEYKFEPKSKFGKPAVPGPVGAPAAAHAQPVRGPAGKGSEFQLQGAGRYSAIPRYCLGPGTATCSFPFCRN